MIKNGSGQKIGAQLVSATDGSAFTGSVTVSVTGDAGTQATGSVGSGACVHEGNGYHTYAPAQAETNYDLIAFTFIGTGAVPATVQVFTTANLVTAVWAAVVDSSGVTTLLARLSATRAGYLDNLAAGAAALESSLQALITTVWTADDATLAEVALVKAKTDLIPASPAAVGSAMTLTSGERTSVADALLARDLGSGSGAGALDERTVRSALRFNRNKFTIAGGVLTVYKEDDSTVAFTAAITQTPGDPVSASDPT